MQPLYNKYAPQNTSYTVYDMVSISTTQYMTMPERCVASKNQDNFG